MWSTILIHTPLYDPNNLVHFKTITDFLSLKPRMLKSPPIIIRYGSLWSDKIPGFYVLTISIVRPCVISSHTVGSTSRIVACRHKFTHVCTSMMWVTVQLLPCSYIIWYTKKIKMHTVTWRDWWDDLDESMVDDLGVNAPRFVFTLVRCGDGDGDYAPIHLGICIP
jgi:hypothetical protein